MQEPRRRTVFKCCSRQLSRVVLSFRFSVLLVDPRSAKAAGAKGINFLEAPFRTHALNGRFRGEADVDRSSPLDNRDASDP
jgi:hypothetical protein